MMSGFTATTHLQVVVWTGSPDCQAAHNALLTELGLRSAYLAKGTTLTNKQVGNLGEFIAFQVGRTSQLAGCETFAHNAMSPLNTISVAGLDITYLVFHPLDPAQDIVYIQEVKTTFGTNLSYADTLANDYEKLFDLDINLTLQSRLKVIANSLELERGKPDLALRATKCGAATPATCSNVRLVPTLVHEKVGTNPVQKLVAVRQTVIGQGWAPSSVTPWSISLTDLQDRLERISQGKP